MTAKAQAEKEAMLRDRFKNRRRMAWSAFLLMAAWTTGIVAAVVTGDGTQAESLSKVTALLGTAFTLHSSIVLAYIGASAYEHGRQKL